MTLSKEKKDRLTQENGNLANQVWKLKKENQALHKNLINEKKVLNNFVGGTSKLNNMLFSQQSPTCKLGLGGKNHRRKFNESLCFVKASYKICTYCEKQGHINHFCRIRNVVHERKYK